MTYDEVVSGMEKYLTEGRFAKANVFLSRIEGGQFIVKDFARKGFWERNLIGRIVIGRECLAYRTLAGTPGIVQHFEQLGPFTLAIEYLHGRDLGSVERHEIGAEVVRQLEAIVNSLHQRGWVHLDLQRRSNILLIDGRVVVVDLASAMHPGAVPLIGGLLVRIVGFADRLSLLKMKNLFSPELLSEADRRMIRLRNLFMPTKW